MLEQSQSILKQRNQIDALEAILLAAGIGQKIGDDVVEAFGLADYDLQQVTLFGFKEGASDNMPTEPAMEVRGLRIS